MNEFGRNGFFLGEWWISPHESLVRLGDRCVHLEPLTMDVLVCLARHAGEVVSRESLETEVWRGAVVGNDALTNAIIKIRKALADSAKQPRYIATIPKRGYQLIADVSWPDEAPADQNQDDDASPGPASAAPRARYWASGVNRLLLVLPVIGLLAAAWLGIRDPHSGATPSSIVVMPFVNLGGDRQQDYLADGITEDITTDLSQLSEIRVVAGNTALSYKDRQVSPEQVGEELDVKFVLKGSVRQSGNELRVNAQLVDTTSGFNVWAERYDRRVADVFAVQDDVTKSIVQALALNLTQQERQRLAKQATANLQAYDYFQEGQRLFKINTREARQQAYDSYRKAIETDASYGRAYGAMAVVLALNYRRDWTDNPVATLDRALELAKKAVTLDDSTPQTWWALGFVYLAHKDFAQAERAAMKSIEVAPNYADGYGLLGLINSFIGNPEKAIEFNDKGVALNPYYSFEYLITYGLAYYTLGQYAKAAEVLEQAQARNANNVVVKYLLCASYVRLGRLDDAQWVADELQLLTPTARLANVERNFPLANNDTKQALLADLSSAGLRH
jgi:TolB-like protein/DNA-binding winged helix-turn-helix (wHTH) protein/cytochrome c-type biogenesis protein CcmH/NrfG